MTACVPLIKNVTSLLSKSFLIPLGLSAAELAIYAHMQSLKRKLLYQLQHH